MTVSAICFTNGCILVPVFLSIPKGGRLLPFSILEKQSKQLKHCLYFISHDFLRKLFEIFDLPYLNDESSLPQAKINPFFVISSINKILHCDELLAVHKYCIRF